MPLPAPAGIAPRAATPRTAPNTPGAAGTPMSFHASFTPVAGGPGTLRGLRLRRLRSPIRPSGPDGSRNALSGDAVLTVFQRDLLAPCAQALVAGEPTWVQGLRIPGFTGAEWAACLLPISPERLDAIAWTVPPASAAVTTSGAAGSLDEVFNVAPFGFAVCAPDGTVLTANGRLCALLGRREAELVGKAVDTWLHPDDSADAPHPAGDGVTRRFLRGDGQTVWLQVALNQMSADGPERLLASFADVSDHGEEVVRLAHTAMQDPLTGLPNRRRLLELISAALKDQAKGRVSVAFLDLDGFKPVNDTLGHAAGDALLREVSRRLGGVIRGGDAVARIGGDEFVVLVRGLDSAVEVEVLAHRVQAALSVPFALEGRTVVTGASVGIAHATMRSTADSLLNEADTAMYAAKRSGRGRYIVYDEGLKAQAVARRATESEIRDALTGNQLEVWYQPIYALPSRRVTGVEALLRWRHPDRGLLTPADFLGGIETSGFGVAVGRLVMERAMRDLTAFRKSKRSMKHLTLTVNLAAEHVRSPGLVTDVRRALETCKLQPDALVIDIAESLLATADGSALRGLRTLRELGIGIAADDFGIGTSSLAGLARLPVTALKIDRALVQGSGAEAPGSNAVVEAVALLGRNLGRDVIAEGVETVAELAAVSHAGVTHAQGFILSRPAAAADVASLLR
jgi:diguanylate cyclase (GGDEF)-like protein/PAS domain S-box-containing protein